MTPEADRRTKGFPLTRDLTPDQLTKATARAGKGCQFGRPHFYIFEYDLEAHAETGWVVCANCPAREYDGDPA